MVNTQGERSRITRKLVPVLATTLAVAGCGASTHQRATPRDTLTNALGGAANAASGNYCQRLDNGKWVTNDAPDSTTPCAVDPRSKGDPPGSVEKRCFSCKVTGSSLRLKRKSRPRPHPRPVCQAPSDVLAGVYHPYRLHILASCRSVSGIVVE